MTWVPCGFFNTMRSDPAAYKVTRKANRRRLRNKYKGGRNSGQRTRQLLKCGGRRRGRGSLPEGATIRSLRTDGVSCALALEFMSAGKPFPHPYGDTTAPPCRVDVPRLHRPHARAPRGSPPRARRRRPWPRAPDLGSGGAARARRAVRRPGRPRGRGRDAQVGRRVDAQVHHAPPPDPCVQGRAASRLGELARRGRLQGGPRRAGGVGRHGHERPAAAPSWPCRAALSDELLDGEGAI